VFVVSTTTASDPDGNLFPVVLFVLQYFAGSTDFHVLLKPGFYTTIHSPLKFKITAKGRSL
jgi:hypothetical protein